MWQDSEDICLLVLLSSGLGCTPGSGQFVSSESTQQKKCKEVQDKKEKDLQRKDKSKQKLQKVLRNTWNRTSIDVSERQERKCSPGLQEGTAELLYGIHIPCHKNMR